MPEGHTDNRRSVPVKDAPRRLVGPIAVAAALAWTATCPAATHRGGSDRCASPHSRTIASSSGARVFIKTQPRATVGRYYGCLRRTGRKTVLNQGSAQQFAYALQRFRLAGDLVAYELSRFREGGSSTQPDRTIVVRDLSTGRQIRRVAAAVTRGAAFAEPVEGDGVRDLVLTSEGDLAWIVQNPFAIAPPEPNVNTSSRSTEVYVAPRTTAPRLLDQGDGINQTSLTRERCTVSWTNARSRRTARVCPL
jgi:hypothetical protein